MKHRLNENGMALITVLLIIVIFSVIGMSLFNYTVSSAKQIKKSELDMQATDVAEMGVVHYENALTLHVGSVLETKIKDVIQELKDENIVRKAKHESLIVINESVIVVRLQGLSGNTLLPHFYDGEIKLHMAPTFSYQISDQSVRFPGDGQLVIYFKSTGKTNHDEATTITVMIEVALEDIIKKALDFGSTKEGEPTKLRITPPDIPNIENKIPQPINRCDHYGTKLVENCNYTNAQNTLSNDSLPNDSSIKNIIMLHKGSFSQTGTLGLVDNFSLFAEESISLGTINNNMIKNSWFYSKLDGGKFGINKGIEDSIFYFNKDIEFNNINSSAIKNTTIYSENGSGTFSAIGQGITDSTLYFNKNITIKSMNGNFINTTIFAGGIADFSNINIPNIIRSYFYIGGDLKTGQNLNGTIDNNTIICVGGKITGKLAEKENGVNIISKTKYPAEYANNCAAMPQGKENTTPTIDTEKLLKAISDALDTKDLAYN